MYAYWHNDCLIDDIQFKEIYKEVTTLCPAMEEIVYMICAEDALENQKLERETTDEMITNKVPPQNWLSNPLTTGITSPMNVYYNDMLQITAPCHNSFYPNGLYTMSPQCHKPQATFSNEIAVMEALDGNSFEQTEIMIPSLKQQKGFSFATNRSKSPDHVEMLTTEHFENICSIENSNDHNMRTTTPRMDVQQQLDDLINSACTKYGVIWSKPDVQHRDWEPNRVEVAIIPATNPENVTQIKISFCDLNKTASRVSSIGSLPLHLNENPTTGLNEIRRKEAVDENVTVVEPTTKNPTKRKITDELTILIENPKKKQKYVSQMGTHAYLFPFHCSICDQEFSLNEQKRTHQQHCKSRRLKCTSCDYTTLYVGTLRNHERIHNNK